ncbi:hypothetical protein BOTCAL_0415g00110 [Botryotinia calthae]|uniref:RING-type domain-containing protein n=1 Tax=Botryotinia calthae TaxID=38488 RepID=A0A4Y8CPK5_9HELO|nr:hypothetical protein BOTCAL_0415g00110 [Botryotinia calthae]
MTKFSNFFREVGGSINSVFHKGAKHSRKPSPNNRPDTPPSYENLFGQPAQLPTGLDEASEHEAFLMRMARDPSILAHSSDQTTDNVPIVSGIYSMSPQVTISLSQAEVEPREATRPGYRYDNLDIPEPADDTDEPFLHLVEEAIAAQSPQPEAVIHELEATPVQEVTQQGITIAANSSHQSRVDTHPSVQGRCMRSKITEDTQLPPRIVSNPEPRATVSRLPIAARSTSLQERSAIPSQPSSRPGISGSRRVGGQLAAPENGESSLVLPRAGSAPQPAAQPSTPVAVRSSSAQPRSTSGYRDIVQRHARVSDHHASLMRPTGNTAQQLTVPRQRPYPVAGQYESDELTGEENPVDIQYFLDRNRLNSRNDHLQGASSSGDINTLRLQHVNRRNISSGAQTVRHRTAQSNEAVSRTEAGNRSSNGRQDTQNDGSDRLRCRSSETSGALPGQRDPIHPGITSPLLIAELRHGRAHGATRPLFIGQHLAEQLDAARTERGIPRSPRVWDIPTPNDETNTPIHPADFREDGYRPANRDPGSRTERPPARANSIVHGNRSRYHAGNSSAVDSMHSREALEREEELQEIREIERQRAIREFDERRREERARRLSERERRLRERREQQDREREELEKKREEVVDSILQPIHIDRCFCLQKFGDGGDPHESVKLAHCTHVFGRSCIKKWLMTSDTCPKCMGAHAALRALSQEARELRAH